MRRLWIRLLATGGGALLIAVIAGIMPRTAGACLGSYFLPASGDGLTNPDGSVSISSLCRSDGYPTAFWGFLVVGFALVVPGIVIQQVMAHRAQHPTKPTAPRAAQKQSLSPSLNTPQPQHKSTTAVAPSLAAELEKLKDLYDSGGLTSDEFAAAKARVLDGAG